MIQAPDGVTNPGYKLLRFTATTIISKEKKVLTFYRDSCCHLALCLWLILLTTAPNELECYITLGWNGLPVTKTLAYWARLYTMKKMKCCEYGPLTWSLLPVSLLCLYSLPVFCLSSLSLFSVSIICLSSLPLFFVCLLCLSSLSLFSVSILSLSFLSLFSVSLFCLSSLPLFFACLLSLSSLSLFSVFLLCLYYQSLFSVFLLRLYSQSLFSVSLLCLSSLSLFSVSLFCLSMFLSHLMSFTPLSLPISLYIYILFSDCISTSVCLLVSFSLSVSK
jgi:hypothetical protein